MAYNYIIYEKRNHTAYITLNRPERMNALGRELSWELGDALADFETDPDTWVGVITGSGDRAFCAGADLKDRAASFDSPASEQAEQRPPRPGGNISIMSGGITKPIIAAVNGVAYGAGCGMASTCDMVVAAENARFGLPEVKRSLVPLMAGSRFIRSMPRKIAAEIMLTGGTISAQEAERWGFVNRVVPMDQLMATAQQLVDQVLDCAPLAVMATKKYVLDVGVELPISVVSSLNVNTEVNGTEDQKEGPRAFVEKRKPVWKGR